MKRTSLALAAALLAGTALAATSESTDRLGVTTSTDPAKAAAVEQHAKELRQDQSLNASGTQSAQTTKHKRKHRRHHATHHASTTGSTGDNANNASSSSTSSTSGGTKQ